MAGRSKAASQALGKKKVKTLCLFGNVVNATSFSHLLTAVGSERGSLSRYPSSPSLAILSLTVASRSHAKKESAGRTRSGIKMKQIMREIEI